MTEEQRATELVDLCGCSMEAARLAAQAIPPPAPLEDAELFLLSMMSCCHPRIGSDDPTAQHGVLDLHRPYAAATNGWALVPGQGSSTLCSLPDTLPLSPAGGLRLADAVTLLLQRAADARPIPEPGIADDASMALLCVEFSLMSEQAGGLLPQSLYIRLHPDACSDETRAVWWAEENAQMRAGATCRAHAIVPCRRPKTGWLSPPDADSCMDRNSLRLSLEPFDDAGSVPTISFQWVRSADLFGALRYKTSQME